MDVTCKECKKLFTARYSWQTFCSDGCRTSCSYKKRAQNRRPDVLSKFGLSESAYDEMLIKQDGKCAICKNCETSRFKGKIKNLAVDHDHISGEVRGLLCSRCNQILGYVERNVSVIPDMVMYVLAKSAAPREFIKYDKEGFCTCGCGLQRCDFT